MIDERTPKQRHDDARQKRAHIVRLSEDQQSKAERLKKRAETVAGMFRRWLDEAADPRRVR